MLGAIRNCDVCPLLASRFVFYRRNEGLTVASSGARLCVFAVSACRRCLLSFLCLPCPPVLPRARRPSAEAGPLEKVDCAVVGSGIRLVRVALPAAFRRTISCPCVDRHMHSTTPPKYGVEGYPRHLTNAMGECTHIVSPRNESCPFRLHAFLPGNQSFEVALRQG